MKIIIADKKSFETHSLLVKFIRIFSTPLLNNIPASVMRKILAGTSRDGAIAVKHGGSTYALEAMYTRYNRKLFSRGFLQGCADLFWHHCLSQPKAIRNRLKIVGENLEKEINNLVNRGQKNITILTIAGGSTRGLVRVLRELYNKGLDCDIKIINIDKSRKAIELSKELAEKFNLTNSFRWICDDARNIKFLIPNNSVDIVEMVGLLDYFSERKSVEVIRQIYNVLKINGVFITANICLNVEIPFIRNIGWPEMYYRKPDDLSRILEVSGFCPDKGKIVIEPLKIHIIAIIRK